MRIVNIVSALIIYISLTLAKCEISTSKGVENLPKVEQNDADTIQKLLKQSENVPLKYKEEEAVNGLEKNKVKRNGINSDPLYPNDNAKNISAEFNNKGNLVPADSEWNKSGNKQTYINQISSESSIESKQACISKVNKKPEAQTISSLLWSFLEPLPRSNNNQFKLNRNRINWSPFYHKTSEDSFENENGGLRSKYLDESNVKDIVAGNDPKPSDPVLHDQISSKNQFANEEWKEGLLSLLPDRIKANKTLVLYLRNLLTESLLIEEYPLESNINKKSTPVPSGCKGSYIRPIFFELRDLCDQCYNLYRDYSVAYFCSEKCYGHPMYKFCVLSLEWDWDTYEHKASRIRDF